MNSKCYKVFGLTIHSEMELPELVAVEKNRPDVHIKFGAVPKHLPEINGRGAFFEASKNDLLLKINSIASFRVREGKYITIMPSDNATQEEIRLFLLGSAIGALLHQRGALPIHGSTVKTEIGTMIITGESATGKSSLATAFSLLNSEVYSDDISVVNKCLNADFLVEQGIPHLKLWKDVINYFELGGNLQKLRPSTEKYRLPIRSTDHLPQIRVQFVIALSIKNTQGFKLEEIHGTDKFNLLLQNTYRKQFVSFMGNSESHFNICSGFAKTVRLFILQRPTAPILIKELAEFLKRELILKIDEKQ